jgi:hypothetical protein
MIRKASTENDTLGADYWIEFRHGQFRAVDVKMRREDFSAKVADYWRELQSDTSQRADAGVTDTCQRKARDCDTAAV